MSKITNISVHLVSRGLSNNNLPSAEDEINSADDLLTVEEAAKELRIGRTSLYALLKSGDLPSITIMSKRFIVRDKLIRFKAYRSRHSLPPGVK